MCAGTSRANVFPPVGPPPAQSNGPELPNVHLEAGCNIQQGATTFCRARLGVQSLSHALQASTPVDLSQEGCQQTEPLGSDMLVTTSNGQVFAVSLKSESDGQKAQLETLRSDSSCDEIACQFKWGSSLSAAAAIQMQPLDVADCILNDTLAV